jgi:uncharacterized phage protein (TIGR02220 family)
MRDSMIFYRSFFEALRELDSETKALLYDSIFEYGLNFKEPVLSGVAKTVFTLIRPQLDANIRKFENGKTGGRPLKEDANNNQSETKAEPNGNQTETTAEANENGNANENPNPKENPKETKVSPEKGNGKISLKERIAKANELVVPYLNQKAGSAFRADTKYTKRMIGARVKEGYGWKDFQAVIDSKAEAWGKDPKMCEFLRPSTLFGTKFEEYLNASKRASAEKPKEPKFTYNSPIL